RLRGGDAGEREVGDESALVRGAPGDEPFDPGDEERADRGAAREAREPLPGPPAAVSLLGEGGDLLRQRAVAVAELLLQDAGLERVERRPPDPLPPLVEEPPGLREAA